MAVPHPRERHIRGSQKLRLQRECRFPHDKRDSFARRIVACAEQGGKRLSCQLGETVMADSLKQIGRGVPIGASHREDAVSACRSLSDVAQHSNPKIALPRTIRLNGPPWCAHLSAHSFMIAQLNRIRRLARYKFRAAAAHHHRRRVRVAGIDVGHGREVADAQPFDPTHAQSRV